MPVITICSPLPSGGKTTLAAGLLAYLHATGRRGAYYKPYSPTPEADADYQFFAGPLAAAADEGGGIGCLAGPPPVALGGRPRNLSDAIDQLEAQAGFVIVELAPGTPPSHAPALRRARQITIARYGQLPEETAVSPDDEPGGAESAIPDATPVEDDMDAPPDARPAAAPESPPAAPGRPGPYPTEVDVITAVPPHRRAAVAAAGVVALPESRTLLAPTVAQVAAHLNAAWVQEPVNLEALVERYLIGGNIMDSGPNYFARHRNQGLIVRAQRPDIQLAGLLPQTRCLVLTGPGETSGYIRAEARERDIPLLQVTAGTIETAEALAGLTAQATPHSPEKAHAAARLLQQHAAPHPLSEWLALGN